MSDESEQQSEASASNLLPMTDEHRWGEPITEERARELDERLREWADEGNASHGNLCGPFDISGWKGQLTGADVFYLAARALAGIVANTAEVTAAQVQLRNEKRHLIPGMPALHLECAALGGAHLKGAYLREAHLERCNLAQANLEGSFLSLAHLEHASLVKACLKDAVVLDAHLEETLLIAANLEGAKLTSARLRGADLHWADLRCANLRWADLERVTLVEANLERADVREAHLEGTDLRNAHLEGTDLRGASFDKGSRLNNIVLTSATFDQVTFDNVNLTVIDWSLVTILGDESTACSTNDAKGKPKDQDRRQRDYKAAARANRVLAVALRAQGLAEDADRFAYRAQVLQQEVLWRQHKYGSYLFSRVLDGLAGYGYRPFRSLLVYLLVIIGFAIGYHFVGPIEGHWFHYDGALIFSVTSFHGRGFFPGGLDLENWITRLAALEAILGLLIEISFIATFTQRFFGR